MFLEKIRVADFRLLMFLKRAYEMLMSLCSRVSDQHQFAFKTFSLPRATSPRPPPQRTLYILYVYTRETIIFMFFNIKPKLFVLIVCPLNVEKVLLPSYSFPAKKSLKKVSFFKSLALNDLRVQRRNFSKISSKNIWLVTKKSLPLHSQIRNEAYNTNKHNVSNAPNER